MARPVPCLCLRAFSQSHHTPTQPHLTTYSPTHPKPPINPSIDQPIRYCWHFPELRELVKDNYVFARCAAYIQDRTALTEVEIYYI